MKRIIISITCIFLLHITTSAQEWILIEKASDVNTFMRIDSIPKTSQNETHFYAVFSEKAAIQWQKEFQYKTLPAYELKSYCYSEDFNYMATRAYNVYDKDDNPLYESFHGFLTYNTLEGYRAQSFANWAYLLKEYGKNACIFASQTQYNNENAQWVKFSEDAEIERYIRIDIPNHDSLAMYKVIYKTQKISRQEQKNLLLPEAPRSRIFVYKILKNGKQVLRFADSFFGKKKAITPVYVYPLYADYKLVEDDVTRQYVEWALLFFEQGKDVLIEKSNSMFNKNIK